MDLTTANNSWLNGSENASAVFEQPPYTEATITVLLVSFIFLLAAPTVLINISLSIAFFKTGQLYKPLGILHIALLSEILLNKLSLSIILCAYYPSALRHCICSPYLSTIFFSSRVLIVSFRPVMYASLALCQLLIIIGKKKYVNRKSACGCVALAIGVGTLFATESAVLTNLNGERLGCTDFCPGQNVGTSFNFPAKNIVMISYVAIVWLPSFVILLISTSWSCIVFKKHYTGGNDQLNRRLLSVPVLLPAVFILTTIVTVMIRRFVLIIVQSYEVKFIHYWLFVSGAMITMLDEILDGILYQLMLTYLNPHLFSTWKRLFYRNTNQVHPQTTTS